MPTSSDDSTTQARFRQLPGIDSLLQQSPQLLERWGHEQLIAALREQLALLRAAIEAGEPTEHSIVAIQAAVAAKLAGSDEGSLRPVFNLSGTILHTNLGRACLPQRAIDAVVTAAQFPSNLDGSGNRRE